MQAVSERNEAMRRTYEDWKRTEAHLHPFDPARRGYGALAQVFGVSYHMARNVITYWRTE